MDVFALIFLAISLIFIGEKTGYRIINFGSFLIFLYVGFDSGEPFLIGIFIFLAVAIMAFSIFGSN